MASFLCGANKLCAYMCVHAVLCLRVCLCAWLEGGEGERERVIWLVVDMPGVNSVIDVAKVVSVE